jgi:hypothetical protein
MILWCLILIKKFENRTGKINIQSLFFHKIIFMDLYNQTFQNIIWQDYKFPEFS